MKKIIKLFLFPLAIAIIMWEELFYKPIQYVSHFIEKNQVVHKVSDKIRHANPYVALLILLAAGLPLIPLKMAALYLMGHGYAIFGIGVFGLAKIVGGATSLYLFNLTEPAIRKIKMMNNVLDWTFSRKDKIKKIITDSEYYQYMNSNMKQSKTNVKEWVRSHAYIKKMKELSLQKSVKSPVEDKVIASTMMKRISDKVEVMNGRMSKIM